MCGRGWGCPIHTTSTGVQEFNQFWSYSAGDSILFPRWGLSPIRLPFHPLRQTPVVTNPWLLLSVLLTNWLQIGCSNNFPLNFNWFAPAVHGTQGSTYIYQFIKGYDKGYKATSTWRDMYIKVLNKGAFVLVELRTWLGGLYIRYGSPRVEALQKGKRNKNLSSGCLWRLHYIVMIN